MQSSASPAARDQARGPSLRCQRGPVLMLQAGHKTNRAAPAAAAFGIEGSTGWLGHLVIQPGPGHGFNCYWKMLPSTEFNFGFTSVLSLTASFAVETATQKGSCEKPEE